MIIRCFVSEIMFHAVDGFQGQIFDKVNSGNLPGTNQLMMEKRL